MFSRKLDKSMERCEKKYNAKMLKLEQKLQSISLNVSNNNNNGSPKEVEGNAKAVTVTAITDVPETTL